MQGDVLTGGPTEVLRVTVLLVTMGMAYLSFRYIEINTTFQICYEGLRDLNLFLVYLSPFYSNKIKANNCYPLFNDKRGLHRVEMVFRLVIKHEVEGGSF